MAEMVTGGKPRQIAKLWRDCLMQMGNVAEALPNLDPDRHVVIAISVETDFAAEDLAQ